MTYHYLVTQELVKCATPQRFHFTNPCLDFTVYNYCWTMPALFIAQGSRSKRPHDRNGPNRNGPTKTAPNQNGPTPERPHSETAPDHNGHTPERPHAKTAPCRNGPTQKRPQTETAPTQNVFQLKRPQTKNGPMAKNVIAERSTKCKTPKARVN